MNSPIMDYNHELPSCLKDPSDCTSSSGVRDGGFVGSGWLLNHRDLFYFRALIAFDLSFPGSTGESIPRPSNHKDSRPKHKFCLYYGYDAEKI